MPLPITRSVTSYILVEYENKVYTPQSKSTFVLVVYLSLDTHPSPTGLKMKLKKNHAYHSPEANAAAGTNIGH